MSQQPRTRVIGIGNDLREDDAVGLVTARRLEACAGDRLDVVEHDGEATSLIDTWAGCPHVVLVDAVRSGAAPGTIVRMDVHEGVIQQERGWYSSHSLGVAEAVALAARLGRLPPSLVVFGIEGQQFGIGDGLSPVVDGAATVLVERLVRELAVLDTSLKER